MNRKLHTPIFACAASAATLAIALLVAWPAQSLDAAGVATAAVPAERKMPASVRTPVVDEAPTSSAPRSRSKRARTAIAMPYFSFARGTGGRS
ncbi:hypothetical protein [Luteimonas deserti]|uniref:Uncharacterized protein n=1 Tax=Luteimonas deserti TaxID=2752306 RepID=A0A7Z0QSV2_9GAMM|nr:hypothetical protein [Luteimonas deserti]NYZ64138.1 hypothetical protein [Luteimonas deserti]